MRYRAVGIGVKGGEVKVKFRLLLGQGQSWSRLRKARSKLRMDRSGHEWIGPEFEGIGPDCQGIGPAYEWICPDSE